MATDAEASTNLFSDCFVEEDVIVDDDIQNDTEQIEIIQPKQNGNENGHGNKGNENGEERKAVVANEIAENTSSPRRSGRQRTTNKYVAKYIEQHKIEHEDAYIEVEVDTDEVVQTIPMTPIQFTVGTTQKGGLCIFHEGYRYTHNSRNSWRCWKKKCWATVHGAHKNEHGEMFGYLGERPHTHPPEPEQEIFKYGAGRKSRAKSINPANKSDPYPQPRVRHYPHLIQHKREIMDEKNTPTSHMVGTSSAASMMAEPPSPVQEMVVVDDDNNKSQPIRIIYTPADSTANASDNNQHHRYIAGGHLQQTTTTFLLDGITLTPGNVLIAVHGNSRAADNYGDNQLIRGKVICVGQSMCNFGHRSTAETMPKPGDEVWVRGRNGFPVDMGMGSGERKLFVFNIWDIAMKLNNF